MSMSMISIKGSSQLPGTGADEVAEENSTALEQVLTVLAESDDRVAIGAQKTAQQFEQFMKQMQERFTILSKENCKLREQLIASESRQREREVLHKAEIQAITDKVSSAETSVETMRQEMVASARSADARVAATVAAQIEAVKTATQAADARVAEVTASMNASFINKRSEARSTVQRVVDTMMTVNNGCAAHPEWSSEYVTVWSRSYLVELQSTIDECMQ